MHISLEMIITSFPLNLLQLKAEIQGWLIDIKKTLWIPIYRQFLGADQVCASTYIYTLL